MKTSDTNVPLDDLYPGDEIVVRYRKADGLQFCSAGKFLMVTNCRGVPGAPWYLHKTGVLSFIATGDIVAIARTRKNAAARAEEVTP